MTQSKNIRPSFASGALICGCALTLVSFQGIASPVGATGLTPEQQEILGHMSIEYLNDGQGGTAKTIRITGTNLQLVNGAGVTWAQNGLGNVIVGYNELGGTLGDDRTGSHCLITGSGNSYSSVGNVVAGTNNFASASWASVLGGSGNSATATNASILGGSSGIASGTFSSICGGILNTASGDWSVVSGGQQNTAAGISSAVSGGISNQATGPYDSVSGGGSNIASGGAASISGGELNQATGGVSAVSGGSGRVVSGTHDWAGGGLLQDN